MNYTTQQVIEALAWIDEQDGYSIASELCGAWVVWDDRGEQVDDGCSAPSALVKAHLRSDPHADDAAKAFAVLGPRPAKDVGVGHVVGDGLAVVAVATDRSGYVRACFASEGSGLFVATYAATDSINVTGVVAS